MLTPVTDQILETCVSTFRGQSMCILEYLAELVYHWGAQSLIRCMYYTWLIEGENITVDISGSAVFISDFRYRTSQFIWSVWGNAIASIRLLTLPGKFFGRTNVNWKSHVQRHWPRAEDNVRNGRGRRHYHSKQKWCSLWWYLVYWYLPSCKSIPLPV